MAACWDTRRLTPEHTEGIRSGVCAASSVGGPLWIGAAGSLAVLVVSVDGWSYLMVMLEGWVLPARLTVCLQSPLLVFICHDGELAGLSPEAGIRGHLGLWITGCMRTD